MAPLHGILSGINITICGSRKPVATASESCLQERTPMREYGLSGLHSNPHGLAIDRHGAIWVAETGGNRIDRLNVSGRTGSLTQWVLPQRNLAPEHIAVSRDGTVWFTEDSNRISHLNPRTGRLDEYTTLHNAYPHGIQMGATGPVFVDQNLGVVSQVSVRANHNAVFSQTRLPSRTAHPEELTITAAGISLTEQGRNAMVRLDGHASSTRTVSPATYHLRPIHMARAAHQVGLPMSHFTVRPKISKLAMLKRRHSTEWKLPHANSEPYDLHALPANRMWLTEDLGNRVALLQLPQARVLEYALPQLRSAPKGLQVRRMKNSTQVWIAAYGINRLLLLDAR